MESELRTLYLTIMRDLFYEGEASCAIGGNEYHLDYSDFGTEVTCNGEFLREIQSGWELEELLRELAEPI